MEYEVSVQENTIVGEDTYELIINKPDGFTFIPGQFIVLEATTQTGRIRRSYSLASSPEEACIRLVIRRQPHGRMSTLLSELRTGAILKLLGPFGHFTLPPDDRPLLYIAAGTGIAPFLSIAEHLAHQNDTRKLILFYSVRNPENILYEERLQKLRDKLQLTIYYTFTRLTNEHYEGFTGRINQEHLDAIHPPEDAHYFICGPTNMVRDTQQLLQARDIPNNQLHREHYGNINA